MSFSTGLRINLQVTGTGNNTWGNLLNAQALQLLEDAIQGRTAFTLSGTKTLTTANGATDEARTAILDVTGGTGGTITIPSVSKTYFVRNGASGNVVVSTGGVTNATFAAGDVGVAFCDASAVYPLKLSGYALKDYIDQAILATTGSLPATVGNEGKSLFVTGGAWTPRFVVSTDLSDYATRILGVQVALAVSL